MRRLDYFMLGWLAVGWLIIYPLALRAQHAGDHPKRYSVRAACVPITGGDIDGRLRVDDPNPPIFSNDPQGLSVTFGDGDTGWHHDTLSINWSFQGGDSVFNIAQWFFSPAAISGFNAENNGGVPGPGMFADNPGGDPAWAMFGDPDNHLKSLAADALTVTIGDQNALVIREGAVAADQVQFDFSGGTCTFANLGTPANGFRCFCTDCTFANPCAAAGTGAWAKRLNGAWRCD